MITSHTDSTEAQRQEVQQRIDALRSPAGRNRLGRFATPSNRTAGLVVVLGVLALSNVSCTDLLLAGHRDDAFLAKHQYALGEQYIDIDGLKLCYQERGQGQAVVILPGLCTSIDYWQLNIPELAEHCRVVALDLPGSGKSDKPDVSYDLVWICDRILAFMDAKGLRQASLIGGSLGGHLAMMIALDHPERVDKLVLMGSCGVWPEPGFLLTTALNTLWNEAVVTDHLRRNWPGICRELFRRQTPVTESLFHYQTAVQANAKLYAPEGRASARAMKSIFFHSCRGRLGEMKQPALLVWGRFDHFHLLSEARTLRAGIPDSRLVIVPEAAHEVMVDQPEVFNRMVLAFLAGGTQAVQDDFGGHRMPATPSRTVLKTASARSSGPLS